MVRGMARSEFELISSLWSNEQDERCIAYAEAILEELVLLQSSCSTFRQLFESQRATQSFIQAFRSFVTRLASANELSQNHIRICEKLMHFGLTLSLDHAVVGPQKHEVHPLLSFSLHA
jgi:uncharacterized membrane protein